MSADFALPLAQSGLCDMCALLVADPEFNGCCSQTCLDQLYVWLSDIDDAEQHTAHWSENA